MRQSNEHEKNKITIAKMWQINNFTEIVNTKLLHVPEPWTKLPMNIINCHEHATSPNWVLHFNKCKNEEV